MKLIQPLLLIALMASPLPALAQQAAATPQAVPVKAAEPDPDPAMLRAMKSRVFEVKHRDPMWLANSLRLLGSGVRGARLDFNNQSGLNTISVRDFPENIAAIEEALKRLDVPTTSQHTPPVDLCIQVLFAGPSSSPESALPEDLQPVVKALKQTLAYRHYTLVATFVQRCDTNANRMIQGRGFVEGATMGLGSTKTPSQVSLEWEASNGIGLELGQNAPSAVLINKFQFMAKEKPTVGFDFLAKIETGVSLKEGEHVVVGTSVVKDSGLVVVLTARVPK
jgi:hypothetical protein